ncbi:hypothetical protein PHLGIDRAFT_244963 [Phlebiopsis gigantea 11061_1 CR5-6]|uniref:WW domain-containing protein n=1 Tax=Phlebiopsis gigantea (strain 11061_1 CR5-6) TaxID=745531 RepID=A0A0C3PDH4_PHLG1|nr:hypothetical protein PHLGIDRAFT_244963 [Phlebiopsis gigantea 11061_1 CR5-6]
MSDHRLRSPRELKNETLSRFSTTFMTPRDDPKGWCRHLSAGGRPYYWHSGLNLYTDAELSKQHSLATEIEVLSQKLRGPMPHEERSSVHAAELVIAMGSIKNTQWGYYFADPRNKTVFWADPIPLSTILSKNLWFVSSNDHLGLELEAQYWEHIDTFPDCREVTRELVDEMRDILTLAYADITTCSTSTMPFNSQDLDRINTILSIVRVGKNNREGVWAIARFMSTFKHERFLHYYGEYGVRTSRTDSAYQDHIHSKRTYLFLCITALLFYVPNVFVHRFEEVCVDGITNVGPWNIFRRQMRNGWEATTIPITVLLSANVALLAIGSIDHSGVIQPHRSVAQIACYSSTTLSLTCYIICWILLRRHSEDSMTTAQEAIKFITQCKESVLGVEGAALMYSLPEALFTWSMLSFLVAVVYMCMVQSDTTTRVITGIVLGLMTLVVLAVLYASWGAVASTSKTLWQRNQEIGRAAVRSTSTAVSGMLCGITRSRARSAAVDESDTV